MSADTVLKINNVSKYYSGVRVLNNVSIDFLKGEVHCIAGENGAGKSTLIKIISGAVEPDSGSIEIGGDIYNVMTPAISRKLGIEVVYQEFNLIPSLCIAENVFIGEEIKKNGLLNFKALVSGTNELFKKMGVIVDPKAIVNDLSVAYMQFTEIAKAISKNVRILIMDEPTAPLTTNEVETLFKLIRTLKDQGVTIIYISHRLSELYEIADRITVMRDGQKIITAQIKELHRDQLIKYMVGRELAEEYPERTNKTEQEVVFKVKNVTGEGINNISFDVKKGEILGLGGLVGAGRTELLRIIFGAELMYEGEIFINGVKIKNMTPKKAVRLGIGFVPEDRKRHGLILGQTVRQNISLPNLQKISKFGIVDVVNEKKSAEAQKEKLRIKTPTIEQTVSNLSGGNQQKVVLAKWLATESKIIFMDEPTRGVDVGAKQEIYHIMNELTARGMSIVMVSSEMEELLGMADRIIVLREGHFAAELHKQDYSQETVLRYASGIS